MLPRVLSPCCLFVVVILRTLHCGPIAVVWWLWQRVRITHCAHCRRRCCTVVAAALPLLYRVCFARRLPRAHATRHISYCRCLRTFCNEPAGMNGSCCLAHAHHIWRSDGQRLALRCPLFCGCAVAAHCFAVAHRFMRCARAPRDAYVARAQFHCILTCVAAMAFHRGSFGVARVVVRVVHYSHARCRSYPITAIANNRLPLPAHCLRYRNLI